MPGKRGRPVSMKNRQFTSMKIGNSVIVYDAADSVMTEIIRKLDKAARGTPQGLTGVEYEHMGQAEFKLL